jgi:hypothetical protein
MEEEESSPSMNLYLISLNAATPFEGPDSHIANQRINSISIDRFPEFMKHMYAVSV